jgi:hypothetical protein
VTGETTTYYGKEYKLVYSSRSRKEANIYASVLNSVFGDYNYGKLRKTLQNMRNLVLIDHVETGGKTTHKVYVKRPYDELVRTIK